MTKVTTHSSSPWETVAGGEDSETVTVSVTNTNRIPVLSSVGDWTVSEDSTLMISLLGTDSDGDLLTYSVSGQPESSTLEGYAYSETLWLATFSWSPGLAAR